MTFAMVWDHLSLVLASLVIAIGVGVPLGLISYLSPKIGSVILRVVDLIQTTPALALLGIIMVFLGAGKPTVIVGLALYSLLPIVRNTCLGLSQVAPHLKEAAKGMGMSRVYSLFHVELPLALPMLFTGIRIAVVNNIGTAVFAASVGGGGIGNIINSGIRQRNMDSILSGTLALMAMALVLDAIMGYTERRLNSRTRKRFPSWVHWSGGVALAAASVVLIVSMLIPQSTEGKLILYDGDYSEVKLMHSMVKQLVEDKTDLTVEIRDQMTQVNNFNELKGTSPSCDLMFSYDGTILTTFLGMDVTDIPEGQSLYDFVNEQASDQCSVHMLGKVGLDNTYALGVTQQVIDQYGVTTISDLIPIAPELTLGAEHEFFTAEGSMKYQPFVDFYGLNFKDAIPVDQSLKYNAVEEGAFDVVVVYATDGLNKRANLTVLEDDREFFPEYNGAFVVRNDLFERFYDVAPNLEELLNLFTGQVDNETMVALTYAVDVEGKNVDQVAHDFLVEQGLID
jgi:osmoprotectant transport system permease protein